MFILMQNKLHEAHARLMDRLGWLMTSHSETALQILLLECFYHVNSQEINACSSFLAYMRSLLLFG